MRFLNYFLFVLILQNFSLFAASDQELRILRAEEARRYVAKITSRTSNIFAPSVSGGHGSSFIFSLTPDIGYIFTNHHVVAKENFEARLVEIEFNTETGIPEKIPGRVVHEKSSFDFSVVEFNPRLLKRARSFIRAAKFPSAEAFRSLTAAGNVGMAYGNPLDANNHSTFGSITSRNYGTDMGKPFFGPDDFIRIEASINGGNSGGPFIHLETGLILGINYLKLTGADIDNFGMVIPIIPLLEEWERVKVGKNLNTYTLTEEFKLLAQRTLRLDGTADLIAAEIPDFFDFYDGAMMVFTDDSNRSEERLQTGDIILKADGEVIGESLSKLDWLLSVSTKDSMQFEVIRLGKKIVLQVPLLEVSKRLENLKNNFLMVSGILFQDFEPNARLIPNIQEGGVMVNQILSGSLGDQMSTLSPGCIIREAQVANKKYKIRSLDDLKNALSKAKRGSVVRLFGVGPLLTAEGKRIQANDENIYIPGSTIYILPIDEIFSPENLSLEEIRENMDLTFQNQDSLNWRNFIRQKSSTKRRRGSKGCGESIASIAPGGRSS